MADLNQMSSLGRLPSHRTKVSGLFREVCERLRHYVTALEPGAPLSEAAIGEQLGISRTPVREALIQLSNEGLIQYRGNGRCHVATLSKQDVIEMSEIRSALEAAAARSLAVTITAEQLQELNGLAEFVDRAESYASARAEWDRGEEAFHRRFLKMAGNSRIFALLERQGLIERLLTLPIQDWRASLQTDPGPTHKDLVAALASGDSEHCDRVFRAHADSRKRLLTASYDKTEHIASSEPAA